jgi:hypothetical protein
LQASATFKDIRPEAFHASFRSGLARNWVSCSRVGQEQPIDQVPGQHNPRRMRQCPDGGEAVWACCH